MGDKRITYEQQMKGKVTNLWKKVNKATSLLVSICMCMSLLIAPIISYAQSNSSYIDVEKSWAKEQIKDWLNKGLVNGYPDNTFKPKNNITRAEFIAIVNRAFGLYKKSLIEFSDVNSRKWYYDDVAKASAAGYISGYEHNKFHPEKNISRQEAAAILCRLLKLDSNNKANLKEFNDFDEIPKWSRDYLNEVVNKGYMTGYPDSTCRPKRAITREETIAILDRALGKYINDSGVYGHQSRTEVIDKNVTINSSDVKLQNTIIKGDLYLAAGIGEGNVELENVTVEGKTIVSGGGEHSVVFTNTTLGEIIIYKVGGKVRVVAKGDTSIGNAEVESEVKLEEEDLEGNGFGEVIVLKKGEDIELAGDFETISIEADGASVEVDEKSNINSLIIKAESIISSTGIIDNTTIDAKDKNIDLKGTFNNVTMKSKSKLEILKGSKVDKMEIGEEASGANVQFSKSSEVKTLELNAASKISGQGKIEKAEVNSENVKIEQRVSKVILNKKVESTDVGGKELSKSTNKKKSSSGGSKSGGSSSGNNSQNKPDVNNSGIINQVKGPYGSGKVKLTITVKNSNNQGIKGYLEENFEVKIGSKPSKEFDEIEEISNFVDNQDGSYNVEFYGDDGVTYEFRDIKVDSVTIEEGPINVKVPDPLIAVTSPEDKKSLDAMVATISGIVNYNDNTVINSITLDIQNEELKFLSTDGKWVNEPSNLSVSMEGSDFSKWYYNLTTGMLNTINQSNGKYYLNINLLNDAHTDCYNSVFYIKPITIEDMYPNSDSFDSDFYPRYRYLYIQFSEAMQAVSQTDLAKVLLTSLEGPVQIESSKIGSDCDKCVLFIANDNLKLNTKYTLSIPKGTLKSVSGRFYNEDINMDFTTAHTVLRGRVSNSGHVKDGHVYLLDSDGNEVGEDGLYEGYIFTNMNDGNYTLIIEDGNKKIYEKEVEIEGGKINIVDVDLNPLTVKAAHPSNNQDCYYPRYTYIHLQFSEAIEAISETALSEVKIISNGDSVDIQSSEIGIDCDKCLLFIVNDNLKLNTNYTLFIPEGTLKSDSGKIYTEDINIEFTTAHTVLKGSVSNSDYVKDGHVYLLDSDGNEIGEDRLYEGYIFTNMSSGNYTLVIKDGNEKIFEKEIQIEEEKINTVDIGLSPLTIEEVYPSQGKINFYPRYTYLFIKLSEEMKPVIDSSRITLTSTSPQEEVVKIDDIRVEKDYNEHVHFIVNDKLKLGTTYTLSIPKGTLKSASGKIYTEDINIEFTTAQTVLKGWVSNGEDVEYGHVYLLDSNGNKVGEDGLYEGYIFINMSSGNYTLIIEDKNEKIYEKEIEIVEEEKNIFDVNLTP